MSIRFGMSMIFLMRPNVRRNRRLFGTRDILVAALLIALPVPRFSRPLARPRGCRARSDFALLELHRAARLLELLLHRLRIGLRDGLLHRLRRTVDEILGLFEAESGELAHHLDDLDLLVARAGEHDREVLLLGRPRRLTGSSTTPPRP